LNCNRRWHCCSPGQRVNIAIDGCSECLRQDNARIVLQLDLQCHRIVGAAVGNVACAQSQDTAGNCQERVRRGKRVNTRAAVSWI
jgi:hypothetical protein